MILVSGLPSSGNWLVRTHIERGVDAAGTGEEVRIWHGDGKLVNFRRRVDERIAMVVPVRDETMRLASVAKRVKNDGGSFPTDVFTCRRNTMSFVVAEGVPVYFLPYEGLLQNPEGLGKHLFEWLSLPWVDWPISTPRDSNRPFEGALYDANAAHRSQ